MLKNIIKIVSNDRNAIQEKRSGAWNLARGCKVPELTTAAIGSGKVYLPALGSVGGTILNLIIMP